MPHLNNNDDVDNDDDHDNNHHNNSQCLDVGNPSIISLTPHWEICMEVFRKTWHVVVKLFIKQK